MHESAQDLFKIDAAATQMPYTAIGSGFCDLTWIGLVERVWAVLIVNTETITAGGAHARLGVQAICRNL